MLFKKKKAKVPPMGPKWGVPFEPGNPSNEIIRGFDEKLSQFSMTMYENIIDLPETRSKNVRDFLVTVFECYNCHKHGMWTNVMEDANFLHSVHMSTFIDKGRWPLNYLCDRCNAQVIEQGVKCKVICKYFPETDMMLQLRYYPLDFPQFFWGWYVVGRQFVTPLGTEYNHEVMIKAFNKVVNVKESWLTLLQRATENIQVMNLKIDDGYYITVMPHTYEDEQKMIADVKANVEAIPKPKAFFAENLSQLEKKGLPFREETYHTWAGPYEELLAGGYTGTAIEMDVDKVREWLEWDLTQRQMAFEKDPKDPNLYSIKWGVLKTEIHLGDVILEGIHKGWTFWEMVKKHTDEATNFLTNGQTLINGLQERFKDYEIDFEENLMKITKPGGGTQNLNLVNLTNKGVYDGPKFEAQVALIQGMFDGKKPTLQVCHCGSPAYITKVIRPLDWPSAKGLPAELVGTDKDPRNSLVGFPTPTYKILYALDCPEHCSYLTKDQLKEENLTIQALDDKWKQNLGKCIFPFHIFFMRSANDVAFGFLGPGAVNLALAPEFISGALIAALTASKVAPSGFDLVVTSTNTNLLLVAPVGLPMAYLQEMGAKLTEADPGGLITGGIPVQVTHRIQAQVTPAGKFEIMGVHEM